MIAKLYRLKEREVRRVLRVRRPVFGGSIIASIEANRLPYNRFAFVVSGKHAPTSIDRNFFRRRFYESLRPFITAGIVGVRSHVDCVCTLRRGTRLDRRNITTVEVFRADMATISQKIFL